MCANKARTESNTNVYGRKGRERKKLYTNACDKERKNRPQMPVAKKQRTDHKCLWQRKKEQTTNFSGKQRMAALTRQANS